MGLPLGFRGKLGARFGRRPTTHAKILDAGLRSMADYYSIIAHAVSRVPNNTDEVRQAIYQRARTALRETLGTLDPSVSANEEAALDAAITTVEADLLFSIMRRFVREEAAPSPAGLSLVTRVMAIVRAATTNFINRNRAAPQRAVDGLKKFFLENTTEAKRLLHSGARTLLRYFSSKQIQLLGDRRSRKAESVTS